VPIIITEYIFKRRYIYIPKDHKQYPIKTKRGTFFCLEQVLYIRKRPRGLTVDKKYCVYKLLNIPEFVYQSDLLLLNNGVEQGNIQITIKK